MSRYRQTMREALEQVYKKEDKDHEVSMARGELEAIADKATQLAGALQGKSDEGNPLEAWVQSKITKAKDYINSVSDYLTYDPSMKQNEELEEAKIISDISGVGINVIKKEVMPFNVRVGHVGPGMDSDYEVEFIGSEPNLIKYAKKHLDFDGSNFSQLKKHLAMEETEVNETPEGFALVSKAKEIAKKFKNNMSKAVAEIEKLEKGLSNNSSVKDALKKANEDTSKDLQKDKTDNYKDNNQKEIDEKISDIFKANKEGESIDNIAKRLKLSTSMVKKLIGEAADDEDKEKDSSKEKELKIKLDKEKDQDALEKQLIAAQGQINILKQKLENEKNKVVKPEPNPETGEVPLTIGIAHAEFKKKKDAEKEEKKEVTEENLQELSKAERDKRIQRAKDMIKYYDAQKKAALKGPNKALAKKMLKNDVNEVSDKLKLKVLKKKIKQYKDKVFKKTMSTVKSPLFAGIEEALEIKEFTSQMIANLKKSFSTAPKRISPEQANKLSKHLDRIELNDLRKLVKANIPFVSTVARNKIYKKTGKFEETNVEEKRFYVEAIAGLQKKADKSGMPYSILKQVYNRGMAAWKSGHRPGASQQQWAFARVNSFITKSSGTWGGADKDLAAKVKGSK